MAVTRLFPETPRLDLHPKTHSLSQCHWENQWFPLESHRVGQDPVTCLSLSPSRSPLPAPMMEGGWGQLCHPLPPKLLPPGAAPAPSPPTGSLFTPGTTRGGQGWFKFPARPHCFISSSDLSPPLHSRSPRVSQNSRSLQECCRHPAAPLDPGVPGKRREMGNAREAAPLVLQWPLPS